MTMKEKYKIVSKFIKDLSGETPDIETYIFVKNYISKYQLNIDINSKPLKNSKNLFIDFNKSDLIEFDKRCSNYFT